MSNNILYFLIFTTFILFSTKTSLCDNVKKSVDDNRDTNDDVDESLDIAVQTEPNNITCTRRLNSQVHEIKAANDKQFPFMASITSHEYEHLCSGTVVSNGLILTTAFCIQKSPSYVLLNTMKSKKNNTTISLHIIKTEKFPTYTNVGKEKDVGLIYTVKHNTSIATKVLLSTFKATRNILDMEVIGYGLNADMGAVKELQYVGIENRINPAADPEFKDSIYGYIDCIDTEVLTCFKDIGGPSIFNNELIGIVTKGNDKCIKKMTASFAVNMKLVDIIPTFTFKAWLDEKIQQNEEIDKNTLATYPNEAKVFARHDMKQHRITSKSKKAKKAKKAKNAGTAGEAKYFIVPLMTGIIIFVYLIF